MSITALMYAAAVSISHTQIATLYRFIFLSSVFVVSIAKILKMAAANDLGVEPRRLCSV
jgi:predicted transporter